jgi:hypothetical protein
MAIHPLASTPCPGHNLWIEEDFILQGIEALEDIFQGVLLHILAYRFIFRIEGLFGIKGLIQNTTEALGCAARVSRMIEGVRWWSSSMLHP